MHEPKEITEKPKESRRDTQLRELVLVFLKLGFTSFGGPAVHIAMMEDEVVRRRRWLTREDFLDLVGAVNLIPGPNSTELAIHLGYRRAGWPGLIAAGICFILPSTFIVTALAWIYVTFGHLPEMKDLLRGMKPVMIAILIQALWRLGKSAMKTRMLRVLGLIAATLNGMGLDELVVLFGAGFLWIMIRGISLKKLSPPASIIPWMALVPGGTMGTAAIVVLPFSLTALFLFFVKVGSTLFGSGYVLLAFLRADLVDHWHWLTESQLLDAITVGQITPGPVFTTATFIGYLLAGGWGAGMATLGIFLPAFIFVALSGTLAPRLRKSPVTGAFLDGVNVASFALMGVVTWGLGSAAIVDIKTFALAGCSALLLLRFQINAIWVLLGGALIGYFLIH